MSEATTTPGTGGDVYVPYDYEEFSRYQGDFYVVMTNLETGKPEYHKVKDMRKQIWMIRASSSLPLLSRTIITLQSFPVFLNFNFT